MALIDNVKKQCTQNINLTMKDHDPSYDRYTFYGQINNADIAKIPDIKRHWLPNFSY